MKRSFHARVAKLEATHERARASYSAELAGASAVEKVRQILSALGIEQQKTESLAETFARALGITSRELRSRLADAARESSWA
jgi:hypothetical protein